MNQRSSTLFSDRFWETLFLIEQFFWQQREGDFNAGYVDSGFFWWARADAYKHQFWHARGKWARYSKTIRSWGRHQSIWGHRNCLWSWQQLFECSPCVKDCRSVRGMIAHFQLYGVVVGLYQRFFYVYQDLTPNLWVGRQILSRCNHDLSSNGAKFFWVSPADEISEEERSQGCLQGLPEELNNHH